MNGIIKYLILILLITLPFQIAATAAQTDDSAGKNKVDWINKSFFVGQELVDPNCIEVPKLTSFHTDSIDLDLSASGTWVPTHVTVAKDKMIKFNWTTKGIKPRPRKYLVLYRIDPRFEKPQLFIQTWDYTQKKYVTDFPKSNSTFADYQKYFNDTARKALKVNTGDVINITLVDPIVFFNSSSNIFADELNPQPLNAKSAYTQSNIDNKILYSESEYFCNIIDPSRNSLCSGTGTNTKYLNRDKFAAVGRLMQKGFEANYPSLKPCPLTSQGKNLACFYDQGRGLKVQLNTTIIKGIYDTFIRYRFSDRDVDFLYYKSVSSGYLDFTTDFNNMFPEKPSSGSWWDWINEMVNWIVDPNADLATNFLHVGRYAMQIEIGDGDNFVNPLDRNGIKVEYIIMEGDGKTTPSSSVSGESIGQNFSGDADKTGYLWLRVLNTNKDLEGFINVGYGYYSGKTWFSDLIYNKIVKPLRDKFNKVSKNTFIKLTEKNPALARISKIMLTLYILLYGLFFLLGSIKITVMDIVTRVIKISIIVALFSENSWNFFNDNVFNLLIDGTDYLMTNIIGISSSKANIFGFMDPIFDKYTDGTFWSLLFIQLLQIHNGLCFFAIMVIYSILLYFRAILEVVIGYVLAFVCLSVMISLAPFFILLMLFEQTRSLFDNWLSTLFSYMIQPTVLLIFFLLIDQVMSEQLTKAVARSCWDILLKISIHLDLNHIGIPLDIAFSLPFLPGIPFYIPAFGVISNLDNIADSSGSFMALATSSLLFYAYCLMCHGLVEYVTIVVEALTNVTPARQSGNQQSSTNPTEDIMGDMKSAVRPVTSRIQSAGQTLLDKTFNQKFRAKGRDGDEPPNYNNKLQGSRNKTESSKNERNSEEPKNNI